MHRVFKRVVFLVVAAVFGFSLLINPSAVAATNNDDSSIPTCTIRYNGVTLLNHPDVGTVNNSTYLPTVVKSTNPNPNSTNGVFYSIDIELSPEAESIFRNCGPNARMGVYYNPWGDIWRSGHIEYEVSSLGNLRYSSFGIFTAPGRNISVDVELVNKGDCRDDGQPICRRAYYRDGGVASEQNDNSDCQGQISEIESAISSFPEKFQLNSGRYIHPIAIDGGEDYFWRACGADNVTYTITNSGTEISSDTITTQSANNFIEFTPTYTGNYTLTVQLRQRNVLPERERVSSNPRVFKEFRRSFCVHQPNGDCVPQEILDSNNGRNQSNSIPYNVCSQIATLTEGQIQSQTNRYTNSSQASTAESSLRERQAKLAEEKARCCLCATGSGAVTENGQCATTTEQALGVYTALGCFPATTDSIIQQLVLVGLSIAGSVALLMILSGAFMLTTSQGEPKRAGEAKEMITSAVMGLLFIIFSVTILQFIGVNILRIPGFGASL